MFIEVPSIDSLIQNIIIDKQTHSISHTRYPVRFIFLPNLNLLKTFVVQLTTEVNVEKIELVDYLNNDNDGWITSDYTINNIKKLNSQKDYLIVSLSELIRFYGNDDIERLINGLIEIDNISSNRRIYIPIVGISNKFLENVPRIKDKEWAPIWEVNGEKQIINVNLINFNVKDKIMLGTKDWLNLWKKEPLINNYICYSKSLCYLNKEYKNTLIDKVFKIDTIETPKDFLKKIYKCNILIEYNNKEKDFWFKLLELPNIKNKDFNEIVKNSFSVSELQQKEIIRLWLLKANEFKKWLLKNYVINKFKNNYYIYYVMNGLLDFEDLSLLKNLWIGILKIENIKIEFCKERRELLKEFYDCKEINLPADFEAKLQDKISKIKDDSLVLNLLTALLSFEKEYIIEFIRQNKIDDLSSIKDSYRYLYHYLSEIPLIFGIEGQKWVVDYFNEYKKSKLNDKCSTKLIKILLSKNQNKDSFFKWYYDFPLVNEVLNKYKIDNLFWIDALGFEWTSLVKYILENELQYNIKIHIAVANLPTTTEYNRYENAFYIKDFDNFIHTEYKYSETLIRQIDLIVEIIKKLPIDKNKNFAIISDHGTSVFPRMRNKKYDFDKSGHSGRYLFDNNIKNDSEDYFIHDVKEKKCVITIKHTYLYKKPKGEVHGGVTPEEVFVPILLSSRFDNTIKEYSIEPKKSLLKRRQPILNLKITPQPDKEPILIINEIEKVLLKYNSYKNIWTANLNKLEQGKYRGEIIIDKFKKEILIDITSGLKENKDFI